MVSLIDRLHHVESVIKFEVERYSSQYEYEEVESHLPSNKDEVADLTYYEEASCEDNDESCFSSQEENNDSACSSSCESDANWEEEINDGSKHSYKREGMNSFSKFERENAS